MRGGAATPAGGSAPAARPRADPGAWRSSAPDVSCARKYGGVGTGSVRCAARPGGCSSANPDFTATNPDSTAVAANRHSVTHPDWWHPAHAQRWLCNAGRISNLTRLTIGTQAHGTDSRARRRPGFRAARVAVPTCRCRAARADDLLPRADLGATAALRSTGRPYSCERCVPGDHATGCRMWAPAGAGSLAGAAPVPSAVHAGTDASGASLQEERRRRQVPWSSPTPCPHLPRARHWGPTPQEPTWAVPR